MRWKWVNIASTYWSRNPSWMFSQWCKGQQFEYYVALAGSTRHAVSVSDLQNTSDQHKTSQELVNLLSLPLLNLWPFTKPFQLSALPLGHETVCINELIFPGYRENTAGHSPSPPSWDTRHQGLHHGALHSWVDVSVTELNHKSLDNEAAHHSFTCITRSYKAQFFFTLRWYSLTTELKYQYFAIPTLASQHLSITICDKCQAILGSSAAHTNMMMHFEASLNNSWQQLIVNFNQVVFCSCYGLWQEHDKAVHHLFILSVAWM